MRLNACLFFFFRRQKIHTSRRSYWAIAAFACVLLLLVQLTLFVALPLDPQPQHRQQPQQGQQPQQFRLRFWVLTAGQRATQLDRLLRKLRLQVDAQMQTTCFAAALDIVVVNDAGSLEDWRSTCNVAARHGATLMTATVPVAARNKELAPASVHLAHLYRWTLDMAFTEGPDDFAVLLEDDLDVAWDLVAFFTAAAAVASAGALDPSQFCVSAWGDNGFLATSSDELAVRRGEHFMGLGWMLSRHTYLEHVARHWPPDAFFVSNPHFPEFPQEWDDYIRALFVHDKDLHGIRWECLYPEVPRTHHTLATNAMGTYTTTSKLQRTRFDGMRMPRDPPMFAALVQDRTRMLVQSFERAAIASYDQWLRDTLAQVAVVVVDKIADVSAFRYRTVALVCAACSQKKHYHLMSDPNDGWNDLLQTQLGLLSRGADGIVRGIHQGVVVLSWLTNTLIILAHDSPFAAALSSSSTQRDPALVSNGTLAIGQNGQSCAEACTLKALACDERLLPIVNSCESLLEAGLCTNISHCKRDEGSAWPAASIAQNNDGCKIAFTRSLSCSAAVIGWQRLCICTDNVN